MADIEFEDRTGMPESVRDYQECIDAVTRLVGPAVMKLPPELAVFMPQIRRCLIQGQKLTEHLERVIAEQTAAKAALEATSSMGVGQGAGICGHCRKVTAIPGVCSHCGGQNPGSG